MTFDCYGTLIDWETGIRRAFKQALEGTELTETKEGELSDLYQEEEKRIEGQMPYRKYRKVLALVAVSISNYLYSYSQRETLREPMR